MNTYITPELVKQAYTKYEIDGDPDSWKVAAKVIDELVPVSDYPDKPAYYFHIKEVWNMCQEYINSTYK